MSTSERLLRTKLRFWVLALLIATGLLDGCGYSYTGYVQCKVVFFVPLNLSNSSPRTFVSFRAPIIDPHHAWDFSPVTSSSGSTLEYLTPIYPWGPTFLIFPPLGNIPKLPLQPIFFVKRGTNEFYIGPTKDSADRRLEYTPRNHPPPKSFLPGDYTWNPHLNGPGSLAGWEVRVHLPR